MKHNATEHNELNGSLVIVPQAYLDTLVDNQNKILSLLENRSSFPVILGDYIPEDEAKELFDRKTTWFWQMRSSGKLAFTKVGNRIFYARTDLQKLLDSNRREAILRK